jgi:peptide/nickel transport system permease protein
MTEKAAVALMATASEATVLALIWGKLRRDLLSVVLIVFTAIVVVAAIFADILAPHDPLTQSILNINKPPSADHWLGTDQYGRDVLSRIIHGARNSLSIGLIGPSFAAVLGTILGVAAGYFGGWVDRTISRFVDLFLAFPALLMGILVSAMLGSGFWDMVAVLTVAFAPQFARLARASTLATRSEPFVEAAVSCGVTNSAIIWRHILPNISGAVIVALTLWIASAIRIEATLSFLGLGTQAPTPSWGNIIRDGLNNIFGSSWPIIATGAVMTLCVLTFNIIGDAVRDVLDPDTSND